MTFGIFHQKYNCQELFEVPSNTNLESYQIIFVVFIAALSFLTTSFLMTVTVSIGKCIYKMSELNHIFIRTAVALDYYLKLGCKVLICLRHFFT